MPQSRQFKMPSSDRQLEFRLFIALPVPESVKDEIERVQRELRDTLPEHGARWTTRTQFHLTLRFLGNVEATRSEALVDAVRLACHDFVALKLRAAEIGFFPDARFPRVVWVGVQENAGRLVEFQRAVAQAVAEFTHKKEEKNFTGHLTLARIKDIKRSDAERLAKAAEQFSRRPFGEWTADAVEIMRSELSSTGARHTCLAAISLQSGE